MNKTAAFYTLGCKVNQYETEAMIEMFRQRGYKTVDFNSCADVYVINTCSVTHMSDRKSRQIIRRAKKTNPDSVVVVTGCYAQTAPEDVLKIEGVNLVIGTQNRNEMIDRIEALASDTGISCVSDIMHTHNFEDLHITKYETRTRAFIKIQEGCNQFCSYCIIPYARGPIRSRKEDEVLSEIQRLAENGFKEIILAGIHVASYGLDLKNTSLGRLLMKADKTDGIRRIRLSSIEPMAVNEEFINTVASSSKLCRHFHLSLQSGCDETLTRMNRKYTTAEFKSITDGIRTHFPDAAITTDIMVGFPGETDEEFNKSCEFVKEIGFADAHVFQYSPRRGTPAADMECQIPPEVKEERSKRIIAITEESRKKYIDGFLGKTVEVLFEQKQSDGTYIGKTDTYISVAAESDTDISGKFAYVKLTENKNNILYGNIID